MMRMFDTFFDVLDFDIQMANQSYINNFCALKALQTMSTFAYSG